MKTKKREQEFSVQVETKVSANRVADLLVGALEGGSCYWVVSVMVVGPATGFGSANVTDDDYYPKIVRAPLSGGALKIIVEDDEPVTLNLAGIKKGLDLMAKLYPKHWADFIAGDDDASTADCFMQLATLGEIVYG